MADMMSDTEKRKQTRRVLDKMRARGVPPRRVDEWTGEEMPQEEAESQLDFEEQEGSRVAQGVMNRLSPMQASAIELSEGPRRGPTGVGNTENPGMVPYSPEEYKRRKKFTPPRQK